MSERARGEMNENNGNENVNKFVLQSGERECHLEEDKRDDSMGEQEERSIMQTPKTLTITGGINE